MSIRGSHWFSEGALGFGEGTLLFGDGASGFGEGISGFGEGKSEDEKATLCPNNVLVKLLLGQNVCPKLEIHVERLRKFESHPKTTQHGQSLY